MLWYHFFFEIVPNKKPQNSEYSLRLKKCKFILLFYAIYSNKIILLGLQPF